MLDPIEIPKKEEHQHTYSNWLNWTTDETISCEERIFCRVCSSCKNVEWKIGNEHDWETITIDPTCQAQGYDDRTCKTCGKNEKQSGLCL